MGLTLPEIIPYILGEKVDNSTAQSSIIVVNAVFLSLVLTTAGLRFWVRYGMLGAGGLDDLLMIIALLFACLLSTSTFIGEDLGLGKHVWNLTPGHPLAVEAAVGKVTKSLYGCYLAYSTAITFTKFSIMATYFRIFSPGMLRKILIGAVLSVFGFWFSSIFAIIFTCIPVKSAWDYNAKGHCYPIVNFFYASAGFNIFTDILLCALPIPTLWALKMPKHQRILLCCLFGGGAFACVASVLRLTHLNQLNGEDVTYETVSSLNWSVIEVDTGIICASISALRPLGRFILPNYFLYTSTSRKVASTPLVSRSVASANAPNTPQSSQVGLKTVQSFSGSYTTHFPQRSSSRNSMRNESAKNEIYIMREFEIQTNEVVEPVPSLPNRVLVTSGSPTETNKIVEKHDAMKITRMHSRRDRRMDERRESEQESVQVENRSTTPSPRETTSIDIRATSPVP